MNDFFAWIYEVVFNLFNSEYYLIFGTLYQFSVYLYLGMIFILIPLLMLSLFYYLWKYPYGKLWHWLLWMLAIVIVTAGITYSVASNEIFVSESAALNDALSTPDSGYEDFANKLLFKYALINGGLSIIIGFFLSLILKRFSKIQIHLPF